MQRYKEAVAKICSLGNTGSSNSISLFKYGKPEAEKKEIESWKKLRGMTILITKV